MDIHQVETAKASPSRAPVNARPAPRPKPLEQVQGDRFSPSSEQKKQIPISSELVHFDSNQDGQIDRKDQSYEHLQVWKDRNRNGQKEAGELQSLAQAGIPSLDAASARQEHLVQNMGNYPASPAPETQLNVEA